MSQVAEARPGGAAGLPWLLLRYGFVGACLTMTYAAFTAAGIELLAWPALPASIVAFTLNLPIAYAGHRYGTFQARGEHQLQARRFAATMSVAFVISTLSMSLFVHLLRIHYSIALIVTTAIVPLINFAVLRAWVFRDGCSD